MWERDKETWGEAHEKEQLILMCPVHSKGGRLGDDGCQGEVGWKEVKEICKLAYVSAGVGNIYVSAQACIYL